MNPVAITLREYQQTILTDVRAAFIRTRRVCLVSPTGSGKTRTFARLTQLTSAKGKRVIIMVHRNELVDQIAGALRDEGVSFGYITADEPMDQSRIVQVASVLTLAKRVNKVVPPDLLIVDECAHAVAKSYTTTVSNWPNAFILGVTATPERLDGKGLGDVFGELVRGPEVATLMDQGYLAKTMYFAPPSVDVSGVGSVGGDFNRGQLAEKVDKPKITGDAVTHYRSICPGAPAIAFCVSVAHAENVAASFRAAGYASESIDGTMTRHERRCRIDGLTNGSIQVLTSCDLIGEGLDVPRVVAIILLRPTQSLAMHLQFIGRGLRPYPGKLHAIILDHADNLRRHGLAEQPRDWSLEGYTEKKEKAKKDEGIVRTRQCPTCYCVHAPAPQCPQCKHVYEGRDIRQVAGTLVPLNASTAAREGAFAKCPQCGTVHLATIRQCPNPRCGRDHAAERAREIAEARSFDELMALGRRRGYKNAFWWAQTVMASRKQRTQEAAV